MLASSFGLMPSPLPAILLLATPGVAYPVFVTFVNISHLSMEYPADASFQTISPSNIPARVFDRAD